MKVRIVEARAAQKAVVRNLLQLYQYEFSAMLGREVRRDGRFNFVVLPGAWLVGAKAWPFLVYVDGRIGGFVFVRGIRMVGGRSGHEVNEFFVMKRHQGRGIGRRVARTILGRFPGWWRVKELSVNRRAKAFWRSVTRGMARGPVREYRDGDMVCQEFEV